MEGGKIVVYLLFFLITGMMIFGAVYREFMRESPAFQSRDESHSVSC